MTAPEGKPVRIVVSLTPAQATALLAFVLGPEWKPEQAPDRERLITEASGEIALGLEVWAAVGTHGGEPVFATPPLVKAPPPAEKPKRKRGRPRKEIPALLLCKIEGCPNTPDPGQEHCAFHQPKLPARPVVPGQVMA